MDRLSSKVVANKISNIEGSRNIIENFIEEQPMFVIKNSYDNKYLKDYRQTRKTVGWTTTSTKTDAQRFVIKTIDSYKYISNINNTKFLRFFGHTVFVPKNQLKGLPVGQLGYKINTNNFSLTNGSTVGNYGVRFQITSGVKEHTNLTAEIIKPIVATKVILPNIGNATFNAYKPKPYKQINKCEPCKKVNKCEPCKKVNKCEPCKKVNKCEPCKKVNKCEPCKKVNKCEPCKKVNKCEPCKKISDLNPDEISKYCPKNEEEYVDQSNILYWQIGSAGITVLFLVILFLYLSEN